MYLPAHGAHLQSFTVPLQLSLRSMQDYYELGVILLRKKLFTQATKNLEKAKKTWDGEPDELAQVPVCCIDMQQPTRLP